MFIAAVLFWHVFDISYYDTHFVASSVFVLPPRPAPFVIGSNAIHLMS